MTPAPGASAELARRLAPGRVTAGAERPITVDQTNASVVVDEAVVVKWFVPPVPVPHPGLELLGHLAAVGFDDVPHCFGAEVSGSNVIAMVSELVPGARDGWDWYVDELTGWVDGEVERHAVVASARRIGDLGGRLDAALAMPSQVLADPVGTVDIAAEHARWTELAAEAAAVSTGQAAAVLGTNQAQLAAVFDLAPAGGPTPACRIHGDLHVGQLLRSGDRLVVTDFDGNPLADAGLRHARRPLAVDAASLVQSVDHAGRVAAKRRPDATAELDELITATVAETLAAYRAAIAAMGCADLLDERLLWPMRVAQELHELVYAARHLPRWAYAPTATLQAMLAHGEPGSRG